MVTKAEIFSLAELARIDISSDEADALRKDLEAILSYVSEISQVQVEESRSEVGSHRNVMRRDENAHESGKFTDILLEGAPKRDGQYFKVKKIL